MQTEINYKKTLEHIQKKYPFEEGGRMPVTIKMSRFRDLLALFNELDFKSGVEIGVSAGRYSKWICQKVKGVKLYCVDPWDAYDEYVEQHGDQGQVNLNNIYDRAKERLKNYNCEFIRKHSMDAVEDFEDNSLDFVFIDGNHSFEYVVNDIAQWSKKVRPGGIISGHDYWRSFDQKISAKWVPRGISREEKIKLCQVKDAVRAWAGANRITPWFITKGDSCPSWFWIKEEINE